MLEGGLEKVVFITCVNIFQITLERFKTGEEFVFVYGDFVLVDSEHDGWTEIPRFDEDPAKMRQGENFMNVLVKEAVYQQIKGSANNW